LEDSAFLDSPAIHIPSLNAAGLLASCLNTPLAAASAITVGTESLGNSPGVGGSSSLKFLDFIEDLASPVSTTTQAWTSDSGALAAACCDQDSTGRDIEAVEAESGRTQEAERPFSGVSLGSEELDGRVADQLVHGLLAAPAPFSSVSLGSEEIDSRVADQLVHGAPAQKQAAEEAQPQQANLNEESHSLASQVLDVRENLPESCMSCASSQHMLSDIAEAPQEDQYSEFESSRASSKRVSEHSAKPLPETTAPPAAAEEARLMVEEEAKAKVEEARLKVKEEARARAEDEAKLKAVEDAKLKAEEETRAAVETQARQKAEKKARAEVEEDAMMKAEELTGARSEEAAASKAVEAARLKAEQEARSKVKEETALKAEEEARATEDEARLRAGEEAKARAKEARLKEEEEVKVQEENLKAPEEAAAKAEEERSLTLSSSSSCSSADAAAAEGGIGAEAMSASKTLTRCSSQTDHAEAEVDEMAQMNSTLLAENEHLVAELGALDRPLDPSPRESTPSEVTPRVSPSFRAGIAQLQELLDEDFPTESPGVGSRSHHG